MSSSPPPPPAPPPAAEARAYGLTGPGDCAITVLHAHGRRLAKLVRADGQIRDYDGARIFDATEASVRDLDHLAEILRELLPLRDRCIVRGGLLHGSPAHGIRRLANPNPATGDEPTLYDKPRLWVAIDLDGLPLPPGIAAADLAACARHAIGALPPEFRGRACIAVATASHGIKRGCRLRLWFWLRGAATRQVLQHWFMDRPHVDLAAFRPAQPCYTAAPLFDPGIRDPMPVRLVVLPGAAAGIEAMVPVRPLPPPPPPRPAPAPPPPAVGGRAEKHRDAALTAIAGRLRHVGEGNRHAALTAEACALFRLVDSGHITDGYARDFIHDAARALNGNGTRRITGEEVDELLQWARGRTA